MKLLPDRLLYCPGLSETGLKGANLNCAVFSPDNDANLVSKSISEKRSNQGFFRFLDS